MLQNLSMNAPQLRRNWLISFLIAVALEMLLPTYAFIAFGFKPVFDALMNPLYWDRESLLLIAVIPTVYLLRWILIGLIFYFSYKRSGIIFLSLSIFLVAYFNIPTIVSTFSSPFSLKYYSITLATSIANAWYIITSTKLFLLNLKSKIRT